MRTLMAVAVLATTGCFVPTAEQQGPTTDGGDAGVGAKTDGGRDGGAFADAGVIPALSALPPAQCAWPPLVAGCANDDGECLVLHRAGEAPLEVVSEISLGGESQNTPVFANDDWYFFTTFRIVAGPPSTPARLVAVPALGGPVQDVLVLEQPTDRFSLVFAVVARPGELWFVAETARGSATGRALHRAVSLGTTWVDSVVFANPDAPTTPAVVVGSDYLVAHHDGLWAYAAAGRTRLVEMEGVHALAARDAAVIFSVCGSAGCTVLRHDRQTGATVRIWGPVDDRLGAIALLGHDAWVLGEETLTRLPLAGPGEPEVVHRGAKFEPGSLKAREGKLYFGSACSTEPDVTGYGTIEVDTVARTARWLNLDPAFPFLASVVPFLGDADRRAVSGRGVYAWTR